MCDIYKESQGVGEELSIDEIDDIFTDKAFSKLEVVRFTGGEPFLREDIGDIIASIKKRTTTCIFYITSNGSLTQKIKAFVEKVLPLGIYLHVQISLDAASTLHDEIRGMPGLFKKVYQTLETLRYLKEKFSFQVGINQTIISKNIHEMEEVHRLSEEFGFSHNITLAAKFHEGRIPEGKDPQYLIPFVTLDKMYEETIRDLYSRINALKRNRYSLKMNKRQSSSSLRDLLEAYLNEGGKSRLLSQKEIPKPLCTAFFTHFRLLPDGALISCSIRRDKVVANLKDEPFSKIWWSSAARKERKEVKACKGCWSECDITPSIFYSGDIIWWYLKRKLRDFIPIGMME